MRNIDVGDILNHINKMYISNRHYRLAEMTLQNLPQCAKLLTNSFINQNKVWSIINPSYQEVYKFMYEKTKEMIEWQDELRQNGTISLKTFLNFVYLDKNDKIVAVATNFELKQYLTKKSNISFSHFDALQKVGHQLQRNIIEPDTQPGRSVYAMFSAIDQDVMGVGLIMLFWIDYGHYLHANGFRILYARMSNPKTFAWVQRFGGMINKLKVTLNEKKLTFSFIRWYLDPLHYNQYAAQIFKNRARL